MRELWNMRKSGAVLRTGTPTIDHCLVKSDAKEFGHPRNKSQVLRMGCQMDSTPLYPQLAPEHGPSVYSAQYLSTRFSRFLYKPIIALISLAILIEIELISLHPHRLIERRVFIRSQHIVTSSKKKKKICAIQNTPAAVNHHSRIAVLMSS